MFNITIFLFSFRIWDEDNTPCDVLDNDLPFH